MKIYTPQIAWHDRKPILSVDIQNRLSKENTHQRYRLATGGHDSRVNIWKITLSSVWEQETPVEAIDCLAELTHHQRPVNVVRFSPNLNDNLLASADDDSLIIIWKLDKNGNSSNMNVNTSKESNILDEAISIESWKVYKMLRGHSQDVADISWRTDGQYLVSGSIDNNIIIWNVPTGKKHHQMTEEHHSFVQGVTWDPLNHYIASLSADRKLILFDAQTGKTIQQVDKLTVERKQNNRNPSSKLFADHTFRSFSRRLAFSPGGELLFAPSGIVAKSDRDGYQNAVYVFERKTLNSPSIYLPLPNEKFSIGVRCCPVVFELKPDTETMFKFPYRIVYAVLTQDSILFYDSQQMAPFAYVSQVHLSPISPGHLMGELLWPLHLKDFSLSFCLAKKSLAFSTRELLWNLKNLKLLLKIMKRCPLKRGSYSMKRKLSKVQ